MKLQVYTVHFDATPELLDFLQRKVDKLETFYDQIISGEAYLRHGADTTQTYVAEIKLYIPGNSLFAKEEATSFEEAIDQSTNALRRQLKKHKEKLTAR